MAKSQKSSMKQTAADFPTTKLLQDKTGNLVNNYQLRK